MTNYRALVAGGFFANPETDTNLKPAIRFNNPGAINGNAAWVQAFPGFVHTVTIGGGNPIAVMETPEQGVALWYELMRKYAAAGATTVNKIITRYGGGQDYSSYVQTVATWAGMAPDTEVDLEDDDDTLLEFAKAMFRYEAGKTTPLSDKQITYGFELARGGAEETPAPAGRSPWAALIAFLASIIKAIFGTRPAAVQKPKGGAPWVVEVRKATGIKEVPGPEDNPVIMAWREDIAKAFPEMRTYAYTYPHDSTPWCGHGLAAAFARVGIRPPFGPTPVLKYQWADSYARDWGIKLTKPITGCVMVFTRDGGGHVGMLEKIEGTKLWVRGFNQSDEVDVSTRTLNSTFTGAFWPKGYPIIDVEPDISNAVQAGSES